LGSGYGKYDLRLWVLCSGSEIQGAGFRVQGPKFRIQCSGFNVQGSGFRVQCAGFRVQSSEFRVQGSMCRVQGSGFNVQGSGFRVVVCLSLFRRLRFRNPVVWCLGFWLWSLGCGVPFASRLPLRIFSLKTRVRTPAERCSPRQKSRVGTSQSKSGTSVDLSSSEKHSRE